MTNKSPSLSIMKKMTISLFSGIVIGTLFLLLREFLINTNRENIWLILNNILFQDITTPAGLKAIGVFYIIGQMFMQGLQLAIVPLVLVSLSLALCKMSNPEKLGRIAGKTIFCFISFYIVGATIAGGFAYFIKSMGWFSIKLPSTNINSIEIISSYNPLTTIINAVPNNINAIFSTNTRILSVIVVAVIIGTSLNHIGEKGEAFKKVLESIDEIIKIYMEFLINKISPIAIFSMITRTFATYGIEYIKPSIVYILSTISIGIFLVFFMYPLGIWIMTKLNPFIFIKKIFKVGIFAAATNSSAVTLPLNKKTCIEELGCSDEITSFVLPTGMTINMNGTTVMHMMAITFIATSAGIDIGVNHLILAAFLSICSAMGTPAIPVAGTTMVFAVLNGLGFTSELCMTGYALVLAMNYPPGMAVITLNVVGDAATNIIICSKENELDQNIYYS